MIKPPFGAAYCWRVGRLSKCGLDAPQGSGPDADVAGTVDSADGAGIGGIAGWN